MAKGGLKIPFDSLSLAAVVAEARGYEGGRVQRVWQPDDHTALLGLYHEGREALLMLSCHPQFARSHFATKRRGNAQPLPALGQALRARIEGGRLVSARQVGFDRILELEFLSSEGPHRLVAELMGKHANLMLLDAAERVIAAAKWVGRSKSSRPIQPGQPYAPPPFEPRPSLLEASEGDDLQGLEGASPFLLRLLAAKGPGGLAEVQDAVARGEYRPVLAPGFGAYPISVAALGLEELSRPSISVALEQHFDQTVEEERARSLKEGLLGQLRRVILAREAALADLHQAADTARRAGELQLMGELILAYGPGLEPGARLLQAEDYEGRPLEIRLKPELGYLDNARAYFDKAKRAKGRSGLVNDQIDRLGADRQALAALIASVEGEERASALEGLRDQARERRWLHEPSVAAGRKEERPYEGHRIRELLGPGGFKVLYGESAEANDYLTLRVARPNDYWLHIRGGTSAHVVVVTNNRPERVDKAVLVFAAVIAVRHSPSKHSRYVAVDYTLRKYVRKPRGSAKGFAVYTHEKTLHVDGELAG